MNAYRTVAACTLVLAGLCVAPAPGEEHTQTLTSRLYFSPILTTGRPLKPGAVQCGLTLVSGGSTNPEIQPITGGFAQVGIVRNVLGVTGSYSPAGAGLAAVGQLLSRRRVGIAIAAGARLSEGTFSPALSAGAGYTTGELTPYAAVRYGASRVDVPVHAEYYPPGQTEMTVEQVYHPTLGLGLDYARGSTGLRAELDLIPVVKAPIRYVTYHYPPSDTSYVSYETRREWKSNLTSVTLAAYIRF